jgi:uncharacterized repeat protein (TIGR03803 family)
LEKIRETQGYTHPGFETKPLVDDGVCETPSQDKRIHGEKEWLQMSIYRLVLLRFAILGIALSSVGVRAETLTLHLRGPGSGFVSSDPAGIVCPGNCQASFPSGSTVTLFAIPAVGNEFDSWGAGCEGMSPSCAVTVSPGQWVLAGFKPEGDPLSVVHHFVPDHLDGALPAAEPPVTDGTWLYAVTQGGSESFADAIVRQRLDGSAYEVLHIFGSSEGDGFRPSGALTLANGVLYGATHKGGANGPGTLFAINTDGTAYTVLHSFTYSETAQGFAESFPPLIVDSGMIYGAMRRGRGGIFFRVSITGLGFTILHSEHFEDDRWPVGELILYDGSLRGISRGNPFIPHVLFAVDTITGAYSHLYVFDSDSDGPAGSLVRDGTQLYGLRNSGDNTWGQLFSISAHGTGFNVLHEFPSEHYLPSYGEAGKQLVHDDGKIYGAAEFILFSINTDGSEYQVLKDYPSFIHSRALEYSSGKLFGIMCPSSCNVYSINSDGTGFTVLHSFDQDSSSPLGDGSVISHDGLVYGTTRRGGDLGQGQLFRTEGVTFTSLYSFAGGTKSNGSNPESTPLLVDSTLYGFASEGPNGLGMLYSVRTDGSGFTVLHAFNDYPDGNYPRGTPVHSNGTLFGVTYVGGVANDGTIFSIGTEGIEYTVLHQFDGLRGRPIGSLTLHDGTLYGATWGAAYSINTDGTQFTTLCDFADDHQMFSSMKLQGGQLFGTCWSCGYDDLGTLFSVAVGGGCLGNLFEFEISEGINPDGVFLMAGDTIVGTTRSGGLNGDGTVYSVRTDGSDFSLLHSFDYSVGGPHDGAEPFGELVRIGNALFGTTRFGGENNDGTVFSIDLDGSNYSLRASLLDEIGRFPGHGALAYDGSALYGTTSGGGGPASSGVVFRLLIGSDEIFSDGFESGSTSAWSD